jgi:DNA helicase-2/ATP-dependent DNA helicase PcrA
MKLDEQEMKLQVAIYALAAKKELEYEPEAGLVRYLGAKKEDNREMRVPLDKEHLETAKNHVAKTAAEIRKRKFDIGPKKATEGKMR